MAAVAALAITAPAQAEKGGKPADQTPEQAQQAQAKAEARGGKQRAQAPAQQAQQAEQRARPERQMRQVEQRVQRVRPERQMRQVEQRAQRVRPERQMRQVEQRVQRARPERQMRQVEQRVQRARPERQMRQVEQRAQMGDRSLKQQLKQQRQTERFAQAQQRFDRRSAQFDNRAAQRALFDNSRRERWGTRPLASVGERLSDAQRQSFAPLNQDWYGDYAAQRYSSLYNAVPNSYYDYNYNDGYLYQLNRDSNLVTGLFPLLGGAFGVGQMMPYGYQSYNVPYGYRSLYYDTPDYDYRYGDGAIYRVDSDTQMIQAVVALLTGQSFGVGQMMPMGYDTYNVPYAYRDQYYDTNDAWYRYDDGYIYQVDPYSRMIEGMYPVSYGGYTVGYPAPSYASYGDYGGYGNYGGYGGYGAYSVPYGYQDLYYGAPGYNYQYANGGIYQVDPSTQLVQALVALVTGQNLGIGQMLPTGYDAYNVPEAYRSNYYDTADNWYRYDDGNIYGVDPRTRMIQSMVPVSYDGYAVGYPMAANAGYAVPSAYDGLYYDTAGYDYRYANGGIYQVDSNTRLVQSIAALLTGQSLGVGQVLPSGYDAYNVPLGYRGQYYDTPDNWYRYADGNIYRVDPQTRVIQTVIDAIV